MVCGVIAPLSLHKNEILHEKLGGTVPTSNLMFPSGLAGPELREGREGGALEESAAVDGIDAAGHEAAGA